MERKKRCRMCDGKPHTIIECEAPTFPTSNEKNYLTVDFQTPFIYAAADNYESDSMYDKFRLPYCPWCKRDMRNDKTND